MKYIFLLILFWSVLLQSFSQTFSVGFRAGWGSYDMSKLDEFQRYRTDQLNLPLKITESYPATPYFRIEAALNDFLFFSKVATFYSFYSTGARSTVSDYSGEVKLDAVLNGNQFGITLQRDIIKKHFGSMGFYSDFSYLLSTLKLNDSFQLYEPYTDSELNNLILASAGFAIEPGLEYNFTLSPLNFQINLGYLIDLSGTLHSKENRDQILYLNNEQMKTQWSGFKIGLQVSWLLPKSTNKSGHQSGLQ